MSGPTNPINFRFEQQPAVQPPAPPAAGAGTVGLWMWSNGRYLLVKQIDPADKAQFDTFKTQLQASLRLLNPAGNGGLIVDSAYIDFSNSCIIYKAQGNDTKHRISLQDASKNANLQSEIDKMRDIGKKLWGSSIPENTVKPEERQYALGQVSNPLLGKMTKDDVLMKEVVKKKLPRVQALGTAAVPHHKVDSYLTTAATAKVLKDKFKVKVDERLGVKKDEVDDLKQALKAQQVALKQAKENMQKAANNVDREHHRDEVARLQPVVDRLTRELEPHKDELERLQKASDELADTWDETTLPVLLAYQSQYKTWLDAEVADRRGLQAYSQIADRIKVDVDQVYQQEHDKATKSGIAHWWKTKVRGIKDPENQKPGSDMALAFVKAGLDEIAGDEYSHSKTGIYKETTFMDDFNRFIFTCGNDDYDTIIDRFNQDFVGDRLGLHGCVIARDGADDNLIAGHKNSLQAKLAVPVPTAPAGPVAQPAPMPPIDHF